MNNTIYDLIRKVTTLENHFKALAEELKHPTRSDSHDRYVEYKTTEIRNTLSVTNFFVTIIGITLLGLIVVAFIHRNDSKELLANVCQPMKIINLQESHLKNQ